MFKCCFWIDLGKVLTQPTLNKFKPTHFPRKMFVKLFQLHFKWRPKESIDQICWSFFSCCCTSLSLYTVLPLFNSGMASYYTKEENKYMEEKAKKYHYIRNGGTSRFRMTFSCNHVLRRSNMRANTCLCLTSSVT